MRAPACLAFTLLVACLPMACTGDQGSTTVAESSGNAQVDDSSATDTAMPTADAPSSGTTRVVIKTSRGDMTIELFLDEAPITTANFLIYAKSGFYADTIFHRVIKGFMAQGGGLKEGYLPKSARNQILNEADNGLKNERLNLAMARTGGAHTATSQFFINDADNAFLNHVSTADDRSYGYCVFGKVVDGVDAYESIINAEVKFDQRADRQKPAAALETITITEVVILDPAVADAAIAAGAVANLAWEEKQAEAKANALNLGIELVAAKDHDVSLGQLSDTGLWTLDVVEGEGRKPALTEKVKVHYTGWVDNGMKFDSSHDRGLPMTHPVNRFVPGFTEGLSGMKIGGTRFFVIPYELGYGAGGNPAAKIPPRTAIVFEVELLDIIGS